jgi:predicted enzyme related to lactoylglutathione lyase
MHVLQHVFRLYVDLDKFEDRITFYERIQNRTCERRINISETGVLAAKVGGFLIFAGSPEILASVRHVSAIFYVDSLDEFVPWLRQNGAELLEGPRTVTAGRNATVRNPDGLIVEYFEAEKQGSP